MPADGFAWRVVCSDRFLMGALRLVMLLVAVVLIYMMFLRSQTPTADLPADLTQSTTPAAPGAPAPAAQGGAHSQYKAALDRAHAAARQMQDQHAEADAAGGN